MESKKPLYFAEKELFKIDHALLIRSFNETLEFPPDHIVPLQVSPQF